MVEHVTHILMCKTRICFKEPGNRMDSGGSGDAVLSLPDNSNDESVITKLVGKISCSVRRLPMAYSHRWCVEFAVVRRLTSTLYLLQGCIDLDELLSCTVNGVQHQPRCETQLLSELCSPAANTAHCSDPHRRTVCRKASTMLSSDLDSHMRRDECPKDVELGRMTLHNSSLNLDVIMHQNVTLTECLTKSPTPIAN